jgi:hypothetical protein
MIAVSEKPHQQEFKMFRFTPRAALVALTVIGALALPASALATNVTTWQLVQQNDPAASDTAQAPYADVPTELVAPPIASGNPPGAEDNPNGGTESLVYGHATFGVDLTYTNISNYQWLISRPGTYATQQIAASEPVALYNSVNREYLADACTGGSSCVGRPIEAYGINLYFSTTPSYEWHVAKGGNPTAPSYVDLYDSIEQAYLIPWSTLGSTALGEVQLGWIHAPFYTGPDYIPPTLPITTSEQGNAVSPLPIK